jgi:pyruvate/2-oxoglutarate dehydrogenase complex dihydrolipoamide dehydrogenase (E3) component
VDRKNVFTYDDYVLGKASVGEKVAVLGGNHGAETAASLGRDKKKVVLIEESDQVAMTDYTRLYARYHLLLRFLEEEKVQIRTGLKVKEITEKGVKVQDKAGKQELIEVDTVILALGRVAVDDLYSALRGLVPKIHKIGDCFEPRRLLEAIQQANIWALSV